MDYRVIFSPTSIRDLADSVAYIARHDVDAANRVGDGLIDAAEKQLASHPRIGPRCPEYPEEEIRYWLCGSYRIVYEIDDATEQVHVLRFWHCAKGDWPIDLI